MTELLEEGHSFNDDQLTAIRANHGVWKVLAGPGSGKTRVLVARYRRLSSHGVTPLCLTFTRAAAEEMEERAGGGNFRTIHSQAYKILRDEFPDSRGFIMPPLDELVPLATEALARHPYPVKYLMVDEAQDCSPQDWDFVSRLSHNIFAVGDAMQCLYGFRKSNPELFFHLENMFPETTTLYLGQNYRSTQNIVNFCKEIAPLRGALLEKMCSQNEIGDPVSLLGFEHNVAEAEYVIHRARELEQAGDKDSTVLARTNRQLEIFLKLHASEYLDLSTIHASKGREWNNVFVIGVQQGLMPFKDGDKDEEARILFVAASRAKKRLCLTRYGTKSRLIEAPGRIS
jgi:superfamily I DNA/RNA helicase